MKRRDKRFISIITSVALTITAVLNSSSMMVTGKEMSTEDLKQALRTHMNDYLSNHEKNLKGDSIVSGALNENGRTDNLEEEVRVIVKLEDSPAIKGENSEYTNSIKEKEEEIKDSQSLVISKAEDITGNAIRRSFGYLVNGFSINVKKKNIEDLKAIDGVKDVIEVKSYKPDMEFAKKITGAENVWKDYNYKGEGMVVSIIDTGIDYTHKDLQNIDKDNLKITKTEAENEADVLEHGKYFTDKVPYGHNYADNNDEVIDSSGSEHGMHVAGIVAANGADEDTSTFKAIKGVAPEAQLLAMKVFGNNPNESSAYDDDIIAAIEDSVKLGADVINMSLGSSSGFSSDEDPENEAVKNATDAGTICVISAGNSQTSTTTSSSNTPSNAIGLKDTSIIGSPSTAKGALSVASMENNNAIFDNISYESSTGENGNFAYSNAGGDNLKLLSSDYLEIVSCGKGIVQEGQDDFEGKDVNGKIALIERGTNTFQSKYENAISKGAKGVIIYNHEDGGDVPMGMSVGTVTVPVFSLGHSDGLKLIEEIEKGDNKFKFEATDDSAAVVNPNANNMSAFTSWGATSDLEFKPEITAPGGQIYSLANGDSYQVMSGTSMASPHTAGSEALILQGVKEKNLGLSGSDLVKFAKNTAMNTAKPMIEDEENSVPFSTRRQGAGLVDIENAIKNNVLITYKDGKSAAALKEVGKTTTFTLQLKNYGDKDVTYDVSKEKVYGETTDENGLVHEVELEGSVAKFDKDKVTVKSNSEAEVNVTLNITSKEESEQFVEGYLHFSAEDTQSPSLVVPFMGFYGDWSKENIVDAPNYLDNGEESILGVTGLVGKSSEGMSYLGTTVKNNSMYIDKNTVAFSPNDDGANDSVLPAVYMLRNSRNQKIQVVDNEGNVIRDLGETEFVRKNNLEDYLSGSKRKLLSNGTWDGTTYDMSTGKYETVKDGQYFIRVTNVTELENSKEQVLDLPVKVDNALPIVEIKNVEKYVDGKDQTHYRLMWTSKDNDGGSGIAPVYEVAINGQVINIDSANITEVNGINSVEVPFVDGEVNDVQLVCSDNAGNMNTDSKRLKAENLKTVAISGLKDGMVVGNNSLVDGKFIVSGTAGDNLSKLTINGSEVKIEDNYFEQVVKLVEGENTIKVYAEDKNGKVSLDNNYKVTLDTKTPEVSIDKNIGDEKPYYTTNESEVEFKATIKDDTNIEAYLGNEKLEVIEGQATGKLKLKNGINKFEFKVKDEAGNETIKRLIVVKGDEIGELDVKFDNMNNFQFLNTDTVKDGVFTVEGHVSKNAKILKLNGDIVKVNDDLTFTYDLKVKEGFNLLSLYAENEDGKVICNYGYKLYYDKSAPKVKLNVPASREDGYVYTNKSPFTVSGTATDNIFGYNVYINGDSVMALEKYPVVDESKLLRDFSKDIDIKEGLNTINISAIDEFDNKYNEDINIVLDTVAPDKPTIKLSNTNVSNKPVKATIDTDEKQVSEIDYSFDGENYIKYTGEFTIDTSSKVYAKVIDYAGNVSEVTEANIEIDTIAPDVSVTGIEEGMTYYNKVKPEITVDDKEAEVTVLLNGKEYNGEVLDIAGKYELEAYAVDNVGNKSAIVKRTFTLSQVATETIEGGKSILVNNGIKPASGEDYIYNASGDNLIASIEDTNAGSIIVTPNTKVVLPEELLKSLDLKAVNFTERLYEDTNSLKDLKSIGKILELELSSVDGKVLKDFGDHKVKVEVKLSEEELKDLDAKKLSAYYFNDNSNSWEAIGGEFLNDSNKFVFEINHLSKCTIGEIKNTSSENEVFNDSESIVSDGGDKSENSTNVKNKNIKTGDEAHMLFVGSLLLATATSFVLLINSRRRKNN